MCFTESPFHDGEQSIQTRLGVREAIEPWARKVVRDHLPAEQRDFYAQLPFLVVAARDETGRPWATLTTGAPGFVHAPDPHRLVIDADLGRGDPLLGAFEDGSDIGALGIELHSRRRNRVNGRVDRHGGAGLSLVVGQSFGNCPQYIQERRWRRVAPAARPPTVRRHDRLPVTARRWIEGADTFFIASGYRGKGEHPSYGMDASHRGGAAGFVSVHSDRTLVFPDYAGNNHFNTLGNLMKDSRAGLLFVDFERGDLLHLSGRAEVLWDAAQIEKHPGAQRLVRFEIEDVVERPAALPLRWDRADESEARRLRVASIVRESADVSSFLFASDDDRSRAEFQAGQYLPILLQIPGIDLPVERTYSLSGSSDAAHFRITVKREDRGLVSRHLHDQVRVGDTLAASSPRGELVLDTTSRRPVVLASAGVGLTPLVSMLHALAGSARPVFFVHGARDGAHHPLRQEVRRLQAEYPNIRLHVAYSRPRTDDIKGGDFHSVGRVDAALLEKLVPDLEADFYLCGPPGFPEQLQAALAERGASIENVHTESFGTVA